MGDPKIQRKCRRSWVRSLRLNLESKASDRKQAAETTRGALSQQVHMLLDGVLPQQTSQEGSDEKNHGKAQQKSSKAQQKSSKMQQKSSKTQQTEKKKQQQEGEQQKEKIFLQLLKRICVCKKSTTAFPAENGKLYADVFLPCAQEYTKYYPDRADRNTMRNAAVAKYNTNLDKAAQLIRDTARLCGKDGPGINFLVLSEGPPLVSGDEDLSMKGAAGALLQRFGPEISSRGGTDGLFNALTAASNEAAAAA